MGLLSEQRHRVDTRDRGRSLIAPRGVRDKPEQELERETGIEPATNGLGSRYSTIELLPPNLLSVSKADRRSASRMHWKPQASARFRLVRVRASLRRLNAMQKASQRGCE
jgi:hypothetical protein